MNTYHLIYPLLAYATLSFYCLSISNKYHMQAIKEGNYNKDTREYLSKQHKNTQKAIGAMQLIGTILIFSAIAVPLVLISKTIS